MIQAKENDRLCRAGHTGENQYHPDYTAKQAKAQLLYALMVHDSVAAKKIRRAIARARRNTKHA